MNPIADTMVITVIGMGVVITTLIALWFITRVVSFLTQKISGTPPFSPRVHHSAQSAASPTETASQPHAQENSSEIVAVITAAATTVLGVPVKLLRFVENRKIQTQGWMLRVRNEQAQSFSNRMNRR